MFKMTNTDVFISLISWQNLEYEKAVAAAYTYVQANPDDDVMTNNLDYYRNLHGITEEHLVDLEEKIHNVSNVCSLIWGFMKLLRQI